MAGYSKGREDNLQAKYLRKVLADVDARIISPASIRGDVLRSRLDSIPEPRSDKSTRLIFFPRGWLSLRSAAPYAAAFVLIVGLFYGLGFNRQGNIVTGSIPLAAKDTPGDMSANAALESSDVPEMIALAPETTAGEGLQAFSEQYGTEEESDVLILPPPERTDPQVGAVWLGGGGQSIQIGTYGGYVLSCRQADLTDPDRELSSPNTLEILDTDVNALIAQIDIPDMTIVEQHFIEGETLALVGNTEESVITFAVDLSDITSPAPKTTLYQPGNLKSARMYKGVLHVLSYMDEREDSPPAAEISVPLPDSLSGGTCIISALDLEGGASSQMAFTGAGEQSKLYDLNAYLYYEAEPNADGESLRIAQINLRGTEMELGGISGESS